MAKSSLALKVVPVVTGIVALLFGPNIIGSFSGPDVVVQRTVAEIPWPDRVLEAVGRLSGIHTMSDAIVNMALKEKQSAKNREVKTPDVGPLAEDLRRVYPGMPKEEAVKIMFTALMLHQFGVMETAVSTAMVDTRNLFPRKVVTLRVANLGNRVARNVDVTLWGNFSLVEESLEGNSRPAQRREDKIEKRSLMGDGRPQTARITYHFGRLPSGEDYGCLMTLWVATDATNAAKPSEWMNIDVTHDEGRGRGRVLDGLGATGPGDQLRVWVRWCAGLLVAVGVILVVTHLRRRRPDTPRAPGSEEGGLI